MEKTKNFDAHHFVTYYLHDFFWEYLEFYLDKSIQIKKPFKSIDDLFGSTWFDELRGTNNTFKTQYNWSKDLKHDLANAVSLDSFYSLIETNFEKNPTEKRFELFSKILEKLDSIYKTTYYQKYKEYHKADTEPIKVTLRDYHIFDTPKNNELVNKISKQQIIGITTISIIVIIILYLLLK